ncbi:MAG: hypothetical protein IKI26_07455, partial [Prevotella sp.]|nr:hypothetical protein [Prevotella sp.]
RYPVRQFSKLLVSATHPNFQYRLTFTAAFSHKCGAKVMLYFQPCKFFPDFFEKNFLMPYLTLP